jgi:sugar/nucleoside kinase (ribokinase family)
MKAPHLLRVAAGPEELAPLFAAAAALGLTVGWLEFPPGPAAAPHTLSSAALLGARRAVAVGPGGSIAVKPRRGEPVLKDILREHFLGCALVLVAGEAPLLAGLPELAEEGEGWAVGRDGSVRRYSTSGLAESLRKPDPF